MKFRTKDGEVVVEVAEGDVVKITSSAGSEGILLASTDNGIAISGDPSLVASIDSAMLGKVYFPPVLSADTIIAGCDNWFNEFVEAYKNLKQTVLSNANSDCKVSMRLYFYETFVDNILCSGIGLGLTIGENNLGNEAEFLIDSGKSDIYAYLVARVLDYCLSQGKFSEYGPKIGVSVNDSRSELINIHYGILNETDFLVSLVESILVSHKIGYPCDKLISTLKYQICNQCLGDVISTPPVFHKYILRR